MVETLVALVVLCVGMLGIAGLYVISLRSGSSAIIRMQAVNMASDMADRIRANRNAGTAYAGAAASNGTTCLGASATCNPVQMAQHDLFVWRMQIAAALPPNATGTVAVDESTTPDTYSITLSWIEPGQSSSLSYTLRLQI
jgi:type IV pilus assembly protein PilV